MSEPQIDIDNLTIEQLKNMSAHNVDDLRYYIYPCPSPDDVDTYRQMALILALSTPYVRRLFDGMTDEQLQEQIMGMTVTELEDFIKPHHRTIDSQDCIVVVADVDTVPPEQPPPIEGPLTRDELPAIQGGDV